MMLRLFGLPCMGNHMPLDLLGDVGSRIYYPFFII